VASLKVLKTIILEVLLRFSVNEPDLYPQGHRLVPWLHSVGSGSGIAMSCGVGHRHGLDLALLWLWHRLAVATTPI